MKVFISRAQFSNSDFKQHLEKAGHRVHGESLLEISAIPFDTIPDGDWLFFYSKSGVQHFFSQIHPTSTIGKKLAVMGPGTAKALKRVGQQPDFVGDGVPENIAEAFGKIARGKKVIFVRAEHSKCSVQQLMQAHIEVLDLIVYENKERIALNLPYCDVLVFTSPMNVRAYFSTYLLHDTQQLVAIGRSTAEELKILGSEKIYLPKQPSEAGLAEVIISKIKK